MNPFSTLLDLFIKLVKLIRRLFSFLLNCIRSIPIPSKQTIIQIVLVAAVTIIVINALSIWLSDVSRFYIPSVSNIRTIGTQAFWDANLANEIEEIRWGTIYTGQSKNVSIYLKSQSNVETIFDMKAINWTFLGSENKIVDGPHEESPYLDLTWDYSNSTVASGEALLVTLILSAEDSSEFTQFLTNNDVTGFRFDIILGVVEEKSS